jgi:ADP-heptose:LPS heptosyltransferase
MYSAVVELLVRQLGATVALTGAPDERTLVARVRERVAAEVRDAVTPPADALTFPAFCALLAAADLVITNNTGPMHIAAAVKTPVVALFARTNPPKQWGRGTCRIASSTTTCPAISATAASARGASSACGW